LNNRKPEFSKPANSKDGDTGEQIGAKITKGLLCLIILQLLEAKQMHKYEILSRIREAFSLTLPINTVYFILKTLEKRGYVTKTAVEGASAREVYGLTDKGLHFLGFDASRTIVCAKALQPIVVQGHKFVNP